MPDKTRSTVLAGFFYIHNTSFNFQVDGIRHGDSSELALLMLSPGSCIRYQNESLIN